MSFDLVVFAGSPRSPSHRATEGEMAGALLPYEALVGALRDAFHGAVRVVDDTEIFGEGWEGTLGVHSAALQCRWPFAEDPAALAPFVRAANAVGCTLYDPQWGACWPAALAGPAGDDPWAAAVFDEFFVFDEDGDGGDDGTLRTLPMRLCPADVWPLTSEVWLRFQITARDALPLFGMLLKQRVDQYLDRFPGWAIHISVHGDPPGGLLVSDLRQWTRSEEPVTWHSEPSETHMFAVFGDVDVSLVIGAIEICAFEIVPVGSEMRELLTIFGDLAPSMALIVPQRFVDATPEVLRTGLRSLDAAIRAQVGSAHYLVADGSPTLTAGANIAWVEAILGLGGHGPVAEVPLDEALAPRSRE